MTEPTVSTSTRVLFVGHDGSSPEIAASLLQHAAGDRVIVRTASTRPTDPGDRSDEMLVGMGLNPSAGHLLRTRALYTADRVVVLGGGLDVARIPGPRYEEWDLAAGDLSARVDDLSSELHAVAASGRCATGLRSLRGLLVRRSSGTSRPRPS